MDPSPSNLERQLCQLLADLPARHKYRYTDEASKELLQTLFWSLAGGKPEYIRLLFPSGKISDSLKLSDAQGAVDGAEYTEAARGKRCGHIFRPGEASYMCRTCGTDETCCLCSRCFDASDHTGHIVRISMSIGNSGCCDCGDDEAWKTPLLCTIHSDLRHEVDKCKAKETLGLPEDFVASLHMTIGRVFDYFCDVISCSPEQLRQSKTKDSILRDEESSRLNSSYYGSECEPCRDFALIVWNDEKHTVQEVVDQVARACRKSSPDAAVNAYETNNVGRSVLAYAEDIDQLLRMSKTMEAIRITMTIRSARDTFREQMCGTLVEWLSDIAGCAVGHDSSILRQTICEQVMRQWRRGSPATHILGLIDDEDEDDRAMAWRNRQHIARARVILAPADLAVFAAGLEVVLRQDEDMGDDGGGDDDQGEIDDEDADMDGGDGENRSVSGSVADGDDDGDDDIMMVDSRGDVADLGMNWTQPDQALEEDEATMAGYPPPPPPPIQTRTTVTRDREGTSSDSDTAEPLIVPAIYATANRDIPKTPGETKNFSPKPGRYWIESPAIYAQHNDVPRSENVFQRVRLDWLLLFDPRMWKKVRNDLRALYISTVVQIPDFKHVLGLRFASLYTVLAQLYLVGDREPDHSIINLSLQMLTTPSITAEVVERGNFMSSLLAILYTFLTTRQVGHPWDVSPDAVLAVESGSVTNRRVYHFYQDLKYSFGSTHVQERIRSEPRYLMQFLDLVKLHQGIGPSVRAITEHVEYEADSWITASLVTRQINLLARNLAESFRDCPPEELYNLQRAIRFTAKTVILNSIGAERHRFKQSEIKNEVKFKTLSDFEFDLDAPSYDVVRFFVEKESISFHHALHYILSWLIECGRFISAPNLRALISFAPQELRSQPRLMGRPQVPKQDYEPEDYLMAAFDYPLRVCAWLAQIKANMWVRNGLSLRHQASTYRGVGQRDVSHHRDIFLLQTAMVVCNPSRVLASIIDRFGMDGWVKGLFELKSEAQDDAQHLDVVEEMIHLLIVLLSDRTSLIAPDDEPNMRVLAMRRDITHVLCFKPLSFNEICNKLPEKYQEQEDFHRVLDEMATFKPPEGVSDVGTFELRPAFIEDIDPYIAHYNKNQREEAEAAYRKKMAKRTGKAVDEIVYEPIHRPIPSGLFENLGDFTGTGIFAQIIYYSLLYPLVTQKFTPTVPFTRLETFLQVVLHLMLIAILEDKSDESGAMALAPAPQSFVLTALTRVARSNFMFEASNSRTIVSLLNLLTSKELFKSVHPKIALVLKRLKQKRPLAFEATFAHLGIPVDRINTASPANASAEEERERKKKAALSRQAKVMAQFQQQQKNFLESQAAVDWGSDLEDEEEETKQAEDRKHNWKYPAGTCILCQEEADGRHLYGTFVLLNESRILRQTDFQDPDLVREASQTPCSLDRSAEDIRPFGIARENRTMVGKLNAEGKMFLVERQTIGRGYPSILSRPGPVASGCGHIMHFRCFEMYYEATSRRHTHQIARHHPEDTGRNEFCCPLCKALGNAFLPIIWKGLEESYPGPLQTQNSFTFFLDKQMSAAYWLGGGKARAVEEPGLVNMNTPSVPGSLVECLRNPRSPEQPAWPQSTTASHSSVPATRSTSAYGEAVEARRPTGMLSELHSELLTAYQRLRDTIRVNGLRISDTGNVKRYLRNEVDSSSIIVQVVGFTLSSVELQQRGVEAQPGMTLLEKIPDQVLTHLRVISETASSFFAIGALKSRDYACESRVEVEFRAACERQHCQLFISRYCGSGSPDSSRTIDAYPPLLSLDPFIILVECSYGLGPANKIDIANLVRLCYLAELVKVIYHMSRNMGSDMWFAGLQNGQAQDMAMDNFGRFAQAISEDGALFQESRQGERANKIEGECRGFQQPGVDSLEGWYSFVKKYALIFLRKSLLLLYVKYGVDFNSHTSPNPEADELDRLTEALRVPNFDEMCVSLTRNSSACGWPDSTRELVSGWIRHQAQSSRWGSGMCPSAVVSHPAIFELIGLPTSYGTLIEEAMRRRCPSTGKDMTDPVICLFCGEVLCSQSTCCQKPYASGDAMIGGAQQHMTRCQRNTGVFLNIRKCCVVYLFNRSGSFTAAPYIDKYGETDHQLRHGRQLFLNQKRYDSMIRSTVLNHGVPSLISRKLEAEISNGGWETL